MEFFLNDIARPRAFSLYNSIRLRKVIKGTYVSFFVIIICGYDLIQSIASYFTVKAASVIFRNGSVSKPFTVFTLLLYREEGKKLLAPPVLFTQEALR